MPTDTTGKTLESLIVAHMTSADSGWLTGKPNDYDRAYSLDLVQLREFLMATQDPLVEAFDLAGDCTARRKFLARLQGAITKRASIGHQKTGACQQVRTGRPAA